MIYYLFKSSNTEYKIWDIDTVTAADFTVEYIIPEEAWETFKCSPEANPHNMLVSFKHYIKDYIEKIVQDTKGVLSQNYVKINISHISFSFDNVEILKLLFQRGQFIIKA